MILDICVINSPLGAIIDKFFAWFNASVLSICAKAIKARAETVYDESLIFFRNIGLYSCFLYFPRSSTALARTADFGSFEALSSNRGSILFLTISLFRSI